MKDQCPVLIADRYRSEATAVVHFGDCMDMFRSIPDQTIQLAVTSPPYNIGKEYERRVDLDQYVFEQARVIQECARTLTETGSVCWQVGNYVKDGEIVPLDVLLYPVFKNLGFVLRNRIVWHFEHGLHCSRRFSGRYETIMWFTRQTKNYEFQLDRVRVPQKYPGKKHFKGPKAGQFSGNPLGKNPGDVWDIPNVKSNHIEKTAHPCQFPVELVERLVLALTNKNDWVLDPFLGVGTTVVAAVRNGRRGIGAETVSNYAKIAKDRVLSAIDGTLQVRPMGRPKYDPISAGNQLTKSPWGKPVAPDPSQLRLLEPTTEYGA